MVMKCVPFKVARSSFYCLFIKVNRQDLVTINSSIRKCVCLPVTLFFKLLIIVSLRLFVTLQQIDYIILRS